MQSTRSMNLTKNPDAYSAGVSPKNSIKRWIPAKPEDLSDPHFTSWNYEIKGVKYSSLCGIDFAGQTITDAAVKRLNCQTLIHSFDDTQISDAFTALSRIKDRRRFEISDEDDEVLLPKSVETRLSKGHYVGEVASLPLPVFEDDD